MGVVDDLDERLDARSLGNTLLAHALGDLKRVFLDTSHDRVWVRTRLGSVIELLNDNSLFSGILSAQDDHDFTWLKELGHLHKFAKESRLTRALRRKNFGRLGSINHGLLEFDAFQAVIGRVLGSSLSLTCCAYSMHDLPGYRMKFII